MTTDCCCTASHIENPGVLKCATRCNPERHGVARCGTLWPGVAQSGMVQPEVAYIHTQVAFPDGPQLVGPNWGPTGDHMECCLATYKHTYIHTYIHTYTHAYIHTYIHTYIHAYIHTYKETIRLDIMYISLYNYMCLCLYV